MKYKHVVYSTGYMLKVTPEDRSTDVMHHLITGGLLGGRSLDGVEWEEIEADEAFITRRKNMLIASMRENNNL